MGFRERLLKVLNLQCNPEIYDLVDKFVSDDPVNRIADVYPNSARLREFIGRTNDGSFLEKSIIVEADSRKGLSFIYEGVFRSDGK